MVYRKILSIFIILEAFALRPAWANFSMADSGTTTAQFLKLGVGGRAIGMGEAYSAVADEPSAIYWNPAGLAFIAEHNVSLMHAAWFDSIYYDFFSYAQPVGLWGVMGIGIQHLSSGDIDEVGLDGIKKGSFNPSDTAVTISWAEDFRDILFGVSIKYIMTEIVNSASAFSADLGVVYPIFLDKAKLSFSMQNIGGKIEYDSEQENLPFNARFGTAFSLSENLLLAVDVNAPVDYTPYACAGAEYMLGEGGNFNLALRCGYNTHTIKSELDGASGIAAGIGFGLWDVAVDYAWAPYGDLGHTHRMSLNYKF